MQLRLLARAAPLLLGAAAAALWLRRRRPEPPALPERTAVPEPVAPPRRPPSGRFERTSERPVDIVTVVDDLLGGAR